MAANDCPGFALLLHLARRLLSARRQLRRGRISGMPEREIEFRAGAENEANNAYQSAKEVYRRSRGRVTAPVADPALSGPRHAQFSAHPQREYSMVWDGHGTENIGQKVGMPKAVKAYDPETDSTVIVSRFRSQIKNSEIANTLLDLIASEPRWPGDTCRPTSMSPAMMDAAGLELCDFTADRPNDCDRCGKAAPGCRIFVRMAGAYPGSTTEAEFYACEPCAIKCHAEILKHANREETPHERETTR